MITVRSERNSKLIHAVFSGMLTLDEINQFSREEQAAVRRMGLGDGEFVLLVEALDDIVQQQEVFDALRSLMVTSPLKARRIATVRLTALTRLQARRGSEIRGEHAVFGDLDEARAWLLEVIF